MSQVVPIVKSQSTTFVTYQKVNASKAEASTPYDDDKIESDDDFHESHDDGTDEEDNVSDEDGTRENMSPYKSGEYYINTTKYGESSLSSPSMAFQDIYQKDSPVSDDLDSVDMDKDKDSERTTLKKATAHKSRFLRKSRLSKTQLERIHTLTSQFQQLNKRLSHHGTHAFDKKKGDEVEMEPWKATSGNTNGIMSNDPNSLSSTKTKHRSPIVSNFTRSAMSAHNKMRRTFKNTADHLAISHRRRSEEPDSDSKSSKTPISPASTIDSHTGVNCESESSSSVYECPSDHFEDLPSKDTPSQFQPVSFSKKPSNILTPPMSIASPSTLSTPSPTLTDEDQDTSPMEARRSSSNSDDLYPTLKPILGRVKGPRDNPFLKTPRANKDADIAAYKEMTDAELMKKSNQDLSEEFKHVKTAHPIRSHIVLPTSPSSPSSPNLRKMMISPASTFSGFSPIKQRLVDLQSRMKVNGSPASFKS